MKLKKVGQIKLKKSLSFYIRGEKGYLYNTCALWLIYMVSWLWHTNSQKLAERPPFILPNNKEHPFAELLLKQHVHKGRYRCNSFKSLEEMTGILASAVFGVFSVGVRERRRCFVHMNDDTAIMCEW